MPDSESERILDRNRNQTSTSALDSHPQLRAYVQCFLETFLIHGRVDPRLRELAILRIAWRCNQAYEWAQHYKRGITVGVTDADALAIRTSDPDRTLDDPEWLVVRAADDVIDLGYLTPETYAACGALFDDDAVLHEFHRMILETELQQRTALRLSLEPGSQRGDHPLRQGRAVGWIAEALSPLQTLLPEDDLTRLVLAIRSATGIEALVWLTDVAGLSREEATALMRGSAQALLRSALGH